MIYRNSERVFHPCYTGRADLFLQQWTYGLSSRDLSLIASASWEKYVVISPKLVTANFLRQSKVLGMVDGDGINVLRRNVLDAGSLKRQVIDGDWDDSVDFLG